MLRDSAVLGSTLDCRSVGDIGPVLRLRGLAAQQTRQSLSSPFRAGLSFIPGSLSISFEELVVAEDVTLVGK